MNYSIEQARQSNLATFPFRIAFVDYRLIGTHEDSEPKNEKEVYDSILEKGYDGPPIAVFQFGSDDLYKTLNSGSRINEAYGVIGVADGHHRFKAIQNIGKQGLLSSVYMPVQLVPAHDTEVIRIVILHEDEAPLHIEVIEGCFKEPTAVIPLCTSHFQTKLTTGDWGRLQMSQPNLKVERQEFIS